MYSRHKLLWGALREFIRANGVSSLVEAGCGAAVLAGAVDTYVGIDMNASVLAENEANGGDDDWWIHDDWHAVDVHEFSTDMFLAASLIEHCESYEPFLTHVLKMPSLKYAVVTFHKGLRDIAVTRTKPWSRDGKSGQWFDNYYCQADVEQWLEDNISDADWYIYNLTHSVSYEGKKKWWDSVLVIDWTGVAQLEMWGKTCQ